MLPMGTPPDDLIPAWFLDICGGDFEKAFVEMTEVMAGIEGNEKQNVQRMRNVRDFLKRLQQLTAKKLDDSDPDYKAARLKDGQFAIDKLNEAIYDAERAV